MLASKIESDEERTYGSKSKAISIQDEVLRQLNSLRMKNFSGIIRGSLRETR